MGLQDFKVMLFLILIAVAANFLVICILAIVSLDFRLWVSDLLWKRAGTSEEAPVRVPVG